MKLLQTSAFVEETRIYFFNGLGTSKISSHDVTEMGSMLSSCPKKTPQFQVAGHNEISHLLPTATWSIMFVSWCTYNHAASSDKSEWRRAENLKSALTVQNCFPQSEIDKFLQIAAWFRNSWVYIVLSFDQEWNFSAQISWSIFRSHLILLY